MQLIYQRMKNTSSILNPFNSHVWQFYALASKNGNSDTFILWIYARYIYASEWGKCIFWESLKIKSVIKEKFGELGVLN